MNDESIPQQSPCPTCGCRLYSERDDLEAAVIRDALRWRQFQQDGGLAAVAEEREACAKVCDANAEHWLGMYTTANPRATGLVLRGYSAREDSAADCATNIRKRSNA